MNPVVKTNIVLLPILFFTALTIAGCSSTPEPQEDQGNSADEQRSRATQTQDELSRETSK
jgi:PBP1b-binding outer membrane lipoprotein LpoB